MKKISGMHKHIRVGQGVTTKVYRFYADTHCTRVEVKHVRVEPVIFRNIRNVNGKLMYRDDAAAMSENYTCYPVKYSAKTHAWCV